jgi:ATPase family protein associated with various cellular activities (AAA)
MANNSLALPEGGSFASEVLATIVEGVQNEKAKQKEKSQNEKIRDAISAMLAQLGGLTVPEDALVFEGSRFVLPEQYEGRIEDAIKFLVDTQKQQRQPHVIHRTFNYRPYDGAHAFMQVMRRITGTTGFGVTKMTIFGPDHPKFITINTSYSDTLQVPWGAVAFPSYEAEFNVGYNHDEEKGILFHLSCTAPKQWRRHIEAIFTLVEEELKNGSIYRGKAVNGAQHPEFLNLSNVDPERVVYSGEVLEQLGANVWAPIEFSNQMRALNIPLKRAVLFAGPYGTGKSLGAYLTAQKAVANGWTFIMCRTGKDDPAEVLKTAELYAPAVVVIEDVDVHTEGGSNLDISRMLEMLDGVTSKGVEVVALFTTNHLDRIQKGALRPGRIDAVIEIHGLDEAGFKKLVTLTVGAEYLDKKVNWADVAEAYEGFLPAFVVEAANRSQRYSMHRNGGKPGVMTTADLVNAAKSLRPQLELMEGAREGANRVTINDLLRKEFEGVFERASNSEIGGFEIEEATLLNGGRGN